MWPRARRSAQLTRDENGEPVHLYALWAGGNTGDSYRRVHQHSPDARKHAGHRDCLDRMILMTNSRMYAEGEMNYDSREPLGPPLATWMPEAV